MDDDVVFFAMVQRYNIYFKYVSLHHDILGSHGAKSSTENIYWADILVILLSNKASFISSVTMICKVSLTTNN